MSREMYESPKSEIIEDDEKASETLSNASGRKKLILGGFGSAVCAFLAYIGLFYSFTKMFSVLLGAYAVIGLVEILAGGSLVSLSKHWDQLSGFKQFLISAVVIILALGLFLTAMPIVAKYTM